MCCMKKALILICILILLFCFAFSGCLSKFFGKPKSYTSFDYFLTLVTLYVNADFMDSSSLDHSDEAWEEMKEALQDMEDKLSVYKEGSDIDKFNKAEPSTHVEVSKLTYDVLSYAKEIYEDTNGAYNPSMYLLSDLWGFTDRFLTSYTPSKEYDREKPYEELPNEEYINGFLSLTDFSQVSLFKEDDKYYVFKPDATWVNGSNVYTMQLDLSGIIKGYASAILKDIAYKYEVYSGYISLGSSSIVLLSKYTYDDGYWDLKLKDPQDPNNYYLSTYCILSFVSTSGNYEQFYEIDGKRYCHIINPATGRPIENTTLSTSCIMKYGKDSIKSATYSDAISTALMVMDYNDAIQYLKDEAIMGSIVFKLDGKNKVYTNINNATILGEYEAYEG